MLPNTYLILLTFLALGLALSWFYFQRCQVTRPPVGVFNLWDVGFMFGAIVAVPLLYLVLPIFLVACLLGLGAMGILYATFEPLLHRRGGLIWLIVLAIIGGEVLLFVLPGASREGQLSYNNCIQVLLVVGAVNLWAQSGMKARDAAVLGAALCIYDVLFTTVLGAMGTLFDRIALLPFAPMVAWPAPHGWIGFGLGDILMAAVFPLLIYKGYSRTGGVAAMLLAWLAIAVVLTLPLLGIRYDTFPLMVVLGPLMVVQYAGWRTRCGVERSWLQFRQQAQPQAISQYREEAPQEHSQALVP